MTPPATAEHPGIGAPIERVDAPKKVTGEATYAAEFTAPGMLYGVVAPSPVARGRVKKVNSEQALLVDGVVNVLTHTNAPRLSTNDKDWQDDVAPGGSPFKPLQGDEILFTGQPLALVVAESFEAARYAARLVTFEIEEETHLTDALSSEAQAHPAASGKMGFKPPPETRGDPVKAWEVAPHKIDATYIHLAEHHNPMELYATLAQFKDGELTVWTKTQGVSNTQKYLAGVFSMSKSKIKVLSPFVGGAFGCALRPAPDLVLAAMAAQKLERPVRVVLTRQQTFAFGHRPVTWQNVRLACDDQGMLTSLGHEAKSETSRFEDFTETVVNWSGTLYQCPNAQFSYLLVPIDAYTPLDMRAPGGATGVHALECAMDELAYAANIDPLEFRLRNNASLDANSGKPFSSKRLNDCLTQGAERFGWRDRPLQPRSRREGNELVGWGVACGIWEVMFAPASAKVELRSDGTLRVSTGSSDIGTGTYTILTQIAADCCGIPVGRVTVELGDSSLPSTPIEGGSMTAASVGTAVRNASQNLVLKLIGLKESRELDGSATPSQILAAAGLDSLEASGTSIPDPLTNDKAKFAHTASFVEVRVDEDLGTIRVSRVVSATAAGRILNPRTARSQVAGCVVWGVSMAIHEESVFDHGYGRVINHNLAEYHVAVNKDIPDAEVIFVHEDDHEVNPLGVKGIGEVGMVGLSAAVANAVFHATGRRVRTLPIQLDDLLDETPPEPSADPSAL